MPRIWVDAVPSPRSFPIVRIRDEGDIRKQSKHHPCQGGIAHWLEHVHYVRMLSVGHVGHLSSGDERREGVHALQFEARDAHAVSLQVLT